MRITDGMVYQNLLRDVGRIQGRLQKAQEQMSSGKKISAPSDDPLVATDIVRLNGQKLEETQFQRNLDFGMSKLSIADTALDSIQTMIERARTLGQLSISNATAGTLNSTEVDSVRDQIISLGNTVHAGRYIFAGSKVTTPPYSKDVAGAVIDSGNSTVEELQVGRTVALQTQIPGVDVFSRTVVGGPMGMASTVVDLFSTLSSLVTAMQNHDNANTNNELWKLEQFTDTVAVERTKVAGFTNLGINVGSGLINSELSRAQDLKNEQDVDITKAITEVAMTQNALQATMASGAKIAQMSLLDYLK